METGTIFSKLTYKITNNSHFNNAVIGPIAKSGIIRLGNFTRSNDNTLVYQTRTAYKSRVIQAVRTNAMQYLSATLTNAYPAYKRLQEKNLATKAAHQNGENTIKLIENGQSVRGNNLYITLKNKNNKETGRLYPMTKYGEIANDSLILGMPLGTNANGEKIEMSISVGDKYKRTYNTTRHTYERQLDSNALYRTMVSTSLIWYDTAPLINLQSAKNLVLTKVEGRDASRKELISGGDLSFSVNGKIVSGYPDIYPTEEVQKFIKIMQYNGVIDVVNPFFQQFNVKQILIKDFNCNQQEGFKDSQPYSFTCVAVEPDTDADILQDTINTISTAIEESPKSGWLKTLLDKKYNELKTSTVRTGASTIISSLDNLIQ